MELLAPEEKIKRMTPQQLKEFKKLQLEIVRQDKQLEKYITEHRIYFFDGVREGGDLAELDKKFPHLRLKGANPKQKEILTAWDDPFYEIFAFTGGNRSGKTTLGTIVADAVMFGEWPWNKRKIEFIHKYPRKIRYVGQDWEKHIKAVVLPELYKWWPKDRPVTIKKNSQGIESLWTDDKTGSSIEIMSNKQEAELHEGWSGDLIVFDEPPKRAIWIANARGLVDRQGRAMFNMTLLKEPFVHREIIKRLDKEGKPDKKVFSVNVDIQDNVGYGLTQKGVDSFESTLRPDEIEARLRGKPSYLSGLIFPKFNRQMHVKERFKNGIPLDWMTEIAIDWHPSKGWAIQFVSTDPLNRKWVIDEIFEKNNYKYICEELVRRIRNNNLRVEEAILIDPLAKSGSQSDIEEETVYDKLEKELFKYGYYLLPASKDQNSGIDLINELLITESEEPALFVFRDCTITIQHMEDWMWDEGKPAADGEDMCENLYRIILRNTQFRPPRSSKTSTSKPTSWKTA